MLKMRLFANLTVSLILCSSGSETETRELERKRKVFPSRGVIDLPSRQINGFALQTNKRPGRRDFGVVQPPWTA